MPQSIRSKLSANPFSCSLTSSKICISSVQFSSVAQSCPTLCDPMNHSSQASLSITNSQSSPKLMSRSSPKLMSTESVMPSNHLILCRPFTSCPQSFPTSGSFPMSQLFASGGQNIGVSSFSISPSNEHPGLISFRMDWLDLLAVHGVAKSQTWLSNLTSHSLLGRKVMTNLDSIL